MRVVEKKSWIKVFIGDRPFIGEPGGTGAPVPPPSVPVGTALGNITVINSLSHVWWGEVRKSAFDAYDVWLRASPMVWSLILVRLRVAEGSIVFLSRACTP